MRRLELAPLVSLLTASRPHASDSDLAATVRLSRKTWQRHKARGTVDRWTADRLAIAAGYHPCTVWPDYLDDELELVLELELEDVPA